MSMTVASHELRQYKCPKCGGPMSHGYITGQATRLRWTEKEKTKTIFVGKVLRKRIDWWNAPTVEAVRYENCKIGIFRYGYKATRCEKDCHVMRIALGL